MLKAAHRLKGDNNFKRLSRKGRSFFTPRLTLRIVKNEEQESRVAFIVSTKVSKKAAVRNKVKRRMREIVRNIMPQIKPGYDILIIAKISTLKLGYKELDNELQQLLKKARLIT